MSNKKKVLKSFIKVVHKEIEYRYSDEYLKNLESQDLVNAISKDERERLKNFFFSTIYPDLNGEREKRDISFESLINLLKEPTKLVYLIPSMPFIMWKFGIKFAKALNAGITSVSAFNLSLKVEAMMIDYITKLKNIKEDIEIEISSEEYRKAYAHIPRKKISTLIKYAHEILTFSKDRDLIYTTIDILDHVQNSMLKRKSTFKKDIEAIDYGKDVLRDITIILRGLSPEKIDVLGKFLLLVEHSYMDFVYSNYKG